MARFLIDEDCPRSLAPALRFRGHDALDVRDAGLRGASDDRVVDLSIRESRILITCDAGIGNILRFPPASHAGIVLLRLSEEMAARSRVQTAIRAADQIAGMPMGGRIVVVEPGRLRIRHP